ncbi:MAG TPA: hypothetical protein VNC60_03140 [Actinomycetota bacterium]|nr:hypothetical protein [Actinomycetota bacterium]
MSDVDAPRPDGWAAHERSQLAANLETTPLERLRWLEEAILFAVAAGAIPEPSPKRSPSAPVDDG